MSAHALPDARQAVALLEQIAAGTPARRPTLPDGPLVLYGAGKLGAMSAQILIDLGIPIAYAIDRHPPADGLLLGRIPVRHPDDIPAAERNTQPLAVCVVTSAYTPIRDTLHEAGWPHVAPVYDVLDAYRDQCGLNNGWFAGKLDADDQRHITRVLAGWHDDASRAAHLQCLAWRVLREEWTFADAPVRIDDRYFIPEMLAALGDNETILDGGAWHGEALAAIIAHCGGHFAAALAVEPDPANVAQLRTWRDARPADQRARITVRECALGDIDGPQAFGNGMDMASRLRADGAGEVEVRRIDALDFSPSVIKLHLEGHELPALHGAETTLKRCRPLLAITTYHNRDGLWRTPAWLMDALPDYHFLMRMHGWCGTGAVVYGIPAERGSA